MPWQCTVQCAAGKPRSAIRTKRYTALLNCIARARPGEILPAQLHQNYTHVVEHCRAGWCANSEKNIGWPRRVLGGVYTFNIWK